ncbi:MAG: carbohydrate porin [Bacteroidetes bacterium]|nr:carbohydrate porin [Bacteroidota bacterium]MCL2303094.1 carbohydrate porin [Lentimicrobiaceae bacterium]
MKKWLIISVGLMVIGTTAAQDTTYFTVEYYTEIQSNFGKKFNWVNLLSLMGELPTEKISKRWKNGSFNIDLITIYSVFNERIIDDLMDFSNIDEDNLILNPFLLGYTHRWDKVSLFGGVRNVNIDYFATPYTTLFTNSSAGIFPTLDANFPLANYPLSAVCLHVEYQPTENWLLKSSLYNGVAHDPRRNPLRSFTVNPREDGIAGLSELSYSQNKFGSGVYSIGILVHAFGKYNAAYSLWGAIEQTVFDNDRREIGFLIHGGIAPYKKSECKFYYAAGGYFAGLFTKQKKDQLGIYFNEAIYTDIREQTMEITWQYQIMENIAIQPTFHCIRTGKKVACIGLFRAIFTVP